MSRSVPPLVPEHLYAWSYIRHRLLTECERAVFWSYVGSRGHGLDPDDRTSTRLAFALKNLTTLPLLVGTIVHQAARRVLDRLVLGRPLPTFEELHAAARFTLNQAWLTSQETQVARFWEFPTAYVALQEIVEHGVLQPWEIARTQSRMITCLQAILMAPVLGDLRDAGRAAVWLPPVGPIQFQPAPGQVAWGAVDVAYRHADAPGLQVALESALASAGTDAASPQSIAATRLLEALAEASEPSRPWCVVDWKTGSRSRPEEELAQLGAYGLWLESAGYPKTHGVYLGRIVDLANCEDRWYVLDAPLLAGTHRTIDSDVSRMRELMLDPVRAVPRPKSEWALAVDQRGCPRCRFHRLCRAELAQVAPPRVADRERIHSAPALVQEAQHG